jgi:hypothetical protein
MKESRIRGEISKGMLLAEDEMGLTDDHSGIMILPETATPGTPLTSLLSFPDWVYDISITPNRPDCTSVLGIAREIAANTGNPLKSLETVGQCNGTCCGRFDGYFRSRSGWMPPLCGGGCSGRFP